MQVILTLIPFPSDIMGILLITFEATGAGSQLLKCAIPHPIYTIHFTCWDSFIFLLVGSEELFTAKRLQAKINVRPNPHDGDNQEFLLFYGAQKLCSNMPRRDAIMGLRHLPTQ